MNKTILRIFFYVGVTALIIAPLSLLYVDREMFFPYITSKNFFWRFFVEIAVLMWASAAIISSQYRISWKDPFIISLGVFMGIILLANTFGNAPYLSFWSSAERMDGYISLLHLAGYFIALVGLIRTRISMERILLFLLGLGLVVAVMGWGQDKGRVDSTLGNPIYLASLSFFGIFISGYFMVAKEKLFGLPQYFRIGLFSLLACAFLYTVFRTGTRGALLGLVGGGFTSALLIALLARDAVDRIWRWAAIAFVGLTLVAGGLFFGAREQLSEIQFVKDDVLLSRLMRISPEDRTTGFRLANWDMAIEGWKERPILGWGQEGYSEVFSKYYDVKSLHNAEQWYDRVHNTFLDWLVFGGILGLLSYVGLFFAILYLIWKRTSFSLLEKSVLTGLFIGYLFQNIVAFDSLVSGIFLYTSFAFVLCASTNGNAERAVDNLNGERTFSYLIIIGLCIATVVWMYHSIHLPREASKDYIQFLVTLGPKPVPERVILALPKLQNVLEHETFFTRELTIQAIQQRKAYLVPGVPEQTIIGYVSPVSESAVRSLGLYNNPTKLSLIYGAYLMDLQRVGFSVTDQAQHYLSQALEQSPNKQNIIWQNALFAESQGSTENAEKLYIRALGLVPENPRGKIIYDDFRKRNGLNK